MGCFLVLTIDIKKSTELVSNQVLSVIEDINKLLNRIKKQPGVHTVGFTTGDEFEIVLETPSALYDVIYLIRYHLSVEYRIGLGQGGIENPTISEPNQMWGSAFNRARDALYQAKTCDTEIYLKH